MITTQSIVSIKSAPLYSEFGDTLVVMDINSGKYFNFEHVARDIWKDIIIPTKVSDLCERLVAEYDAPADRIQNSVLVFLEKLHKHDLILVDSGLLAEPSGS